MLPLLCTFCIKMWNAQLLAIGSVLLQLHPGTVSSQAADRCTTENIVVLAGRVLCPKLLMKQTTRIPLVHMYLCVSFFCKFILLIYFVSLYSWFILLWFGGLFLLFWTFHLAVEKGTACCFWSFLVLSLRGHQSLLLYSIPTNMSSAHTQNCNTPIYKRSVYCQIHF